GVRTFGSVFTNPPGDSAGRLLEAAGCKGLAHGGARFSPVHANFIEASPGCRAADVLALMSEGLRRVAAAGGPVLTPEVRYLDPVRGVIHAPVEAP
ncbi:MAG: UDP-N-acetylenolpyruvoylglucosamine reductase, partial [Thermoleophilia bacterium]|nr:UDP-N-acetylenolpyruvoylglucosamine reductase [Thermoleophilia bacterium]